MKNLKPKDFWNSTIIRSGALIAVIGLISLVTGIDINENFLGQLKDLQTGILRDLIVSIAGAYVTGRRFAQQALIKPLAVNESK